MTKTLFELHPTHNPHRWRLPVTQQVSVGREGAPFMFGGVGLAASVTALERTCERPVIWATAQYLSFARPPAILDLDVWIPVNGQQTTQARVIGHVDDQEILAVNAALGDRPGLADDRWVSAPAVPPPADCRRGYTRAPGEIAGLHDRLEIRIAHGRFRTEPMGGERSPDGRLTLWLRAIGGEPVDSGMLAVMADYLPSAVSSAVGEFFFANSLDNTIRFAGRDATEWVLADIHIESLHRGFAHGAMRMFSERGQLLAIGSQSMVLRRPGPRPPG